MYTQIKLNITEAQARRALDGKAFRVTSQQIGKGDTFISLHPANVKAVEKAALKGSGMSLNLSPGELADTAMRLDGSGFWGSIWNTLKKGWKVLRDSGAATALADAAVAPLAAVVGPQAATLGRKVFKNLTGASVNRSTKASRRELLQGKGLYLS